MIHVADVQISHRLAGALTGGYQQRSQLPYLLPILVADIESAIDWWMDAFLPLGALPPQRLQAAINAAYTAAEEQDSAAMAAERVLAAVPEAEAEVIRAELARIKLSGKRWWLVGGDHVRGGTCRHG